MGGQDDALHRRQGPPADAALPECLDDYVTQDNPVWVIDAFIDELDLWAFFARAQPAATDRMTAPIAIRLARS
jgi:hypothetical protein